MHVLDLSTQDAKRVADRMVKRLERSGIAVPFPTMLETLSAGFKFRDWNTMSDAVKGGSALTPSPVPSVLQAPAVSDHSSQFFRWVVGHDTLGQPQSSRQRPFRPAYGGKKPFAEIVLGAARTGKSLLCAAANLDFAIVGEKVPHLGDPVLGVVEFHPTSKATFDIIRRSLPPERAGEVAYCDLNLKASSAVNFFDTPPGCRKPGHVQRCAIVNILTLLMTRFPVRDRFAAEALAEALVDMAYEKFGDMKENGTPREYAEGIDLEVDAAVVRLTGLKDNPTWWDVADALSDQSDLAERAQSHAVPRASDLHLLVMKAAGAVFGNFDAYLRDELDYALTMTLRDYPVLAMPTHPDMAMGKARIRGVSICGVFEHLKAKDDFASALAFLLARHLVAKGQFVETFDDDAFPAQYAAHHSAEARRRLWRNKRLVFDDVQFAVNHLPICEQFAQDIRQGAAAGVNVVVVAPNADCLGNKITALSDRHWILVTNATYVNGLGSDIAMSMSNEALGCIHETLRASRCDVTHCLIFDRVQTQRETHVSLELSAALIWTLTTTPIDVELKNKLVKRVSFHDAVKKLAAAYPSGSAAMEIEQLRRLQERESGLDFEIVTTDAFVSFNKSKALDAIVAAMLR